MCVCVCFGSWMLCIYVERCFESKICWLDLCLSSLLVAFISMCFSLLEKHFFFKLDSFSTDPWQIPFYRALLSPLLYKSWWILDPSRFLGFSSIDSWQPFRSIEPNFWALCLADRFSTYSWPIEVILPSTDPWQHLDKFISVEI